MCVVECYVAFKRMSGGVHCWPIRWKGTLSNGMLSAECEERIQREHNRNCDLKLYRMSRKTLVLFELEQSFVLRGILGYLWGFFVDMAMTWTELITAWSKMANHPPNAKGFQRILCLILTGRRKKLCWMTEWTDVELSSLLNRQLSVRYVQHDVSHCCSLPTWSTGLCLPLYDSPGCSLSCGVLSHTYCNLNVKDLDCIMMQFLIKPPAKWQVVRTFQN